ncbi:MAG: glycosyltransferase family 2 protein [Candidatus Marinimicrobia bacterium]|nr:glycosyltransferase family 2 protein [Candidatus Neomarinimicrobiota bacterium]
MKKEENLLGRKNVNAPRIGIVTVLYNSEDVLSEYYHSLNIQSFTNFILYVVDNNSPDHSLTHSRELLTEVDFKYHIIVNESNFGVAKGNNIGIRQAMADECDLILLSNNDIKLKGDTIQKLVDGLADSNAAMAVPKIYYYKTNKLWFAGGHIDIDNGTTRHRGIGEEDIGQYDEVESIGYAPTCFMLINKSIFLNVGFMDEVYFVYYDDTDFVYRVIDKYHQDLIYIPSSTIEHNESHSTGGGESPFTLFYKSRNRIYFMRKHLKRHQVVRVFLVVMLKHIIKYLINYKKSRVAWRQGISGLREGIRLKIDKV